MGLDTVKQAVPIQDTIDIQDGFARFNTSRYSLVEIRSASLKEVRSNRDLILLLFYSIASSLFLVLGLIRLFYSTSLDIFGLVSVLIGAPLTILAVRAIYRSLSDVIYSIYALQLQGKFGRAIPMVSLDMQQAKDVLQAIQAGIESPSRASFHAGSSIEVNQDHIDINGAYHAIGAVASAHVTKLPKDKIWVVCDYVVTIAAVLWLVGSILQAMSDFHLIEGTYRILSSVGLFFLFLTMALRQAGYINKTSNISVIEVRNTSGTHPLYATLDEAGADATAALITKEIKARKALPGTQRTG